MILKAAWVVPVTSPPIRDGYVDIEEGRIVGVGRSRALDRRDRAGHQFGDVALLPGLVNPHTHLELGCYAGCLEPGPFWPWIERLIELRGEPGQIEREQQAVTEGAWQSLRAGVTCVGDISRRNLNWQALKQVPIRKVCYVELLSLADHPPRNLAELREAVDAVEEDELLTVGLTAHAPYSVPGDQIRGVIALAAERVRPWTTHWAETREEVAFLKGREDALPAVLQVLLKRCRMRPPGLSPIEFLLECGSAGRAGSLAHVNYIERYEVQPLASAGHTVIYCPRAHHFFGHPPHPFQRLRQAGIRVAVGTDSAASNQGLSQLEELRQIHEHVPDPPSAESLLRMATIEAAHALGLETQIGSLEAGKQADLAAFPCAPDEPDPVAALIAQPVAPGGVWVAGQQVI